ncbi:uncharacterized protein LOC131237641 [Magnolia sinica]|uniref:uncharacterized protein LOC131237641 n=1 Tax=Magnolia sinica TaxID=86752 RepID=UPI0026596942|nr:uncharacterized protein LOC131237641 [Magnolia sinica]
MFQTKTFSSSFSLLSHPFPSSHTKPSLSLPLPSIPNKKTQHCIATEELFPSSQPHKDEEALGLRFVRGNKLLKELGTWGIGGPCRYFVEVFDQTQLVSTIRYCRLRSIQFLIIGKGSNCLFDDRGFNGCIILNRIDFLERIGPGVYRAGSGYPFNRLGIQCSNDGFTGLEFAGGIPGTVGGAVYMNAGADGQETANSIDSIEIVTMDGRQQVLNACELVFGYRRSPFQEMEDIAAIAAVTFGLTASVNAMERQRVYLGRRKKSQPIRERSAGSVFRNPSGLGISAGELIDRAGLKGLEVGGAKVSNIHTNFFINFNGSTSMDMLELINRVKEEVDRKFGIELEEEIRYVPYNFK